MTRQLEAVFVGGVLRPLEPLLLTENQHVIVTISDLAGPATSLSRAEEMKWLSAHGDEFRGQWLALRGSELLSSGPRALVVREEARQKGCPRPLMVRLSDGEVFSPGCGEVVSELHSQPRLLGAAECLR